MEENRKPCPILDIDGVISGGKQFDLDITLPEDNRDVIYGVIKNCFKEPVKDAVVKLVEIIYNCGKEERRPIGHTFTDCEGEFVFGPLCPGKQYALQIGVNDTKKMKICAKCHHEGHCLRAIFAPLIAPKIPYTANIVPNFKSTFWSFIFIIIAIIDVGIKKTKFVACAICCSTPSIFVSRNINIVPPPIPVPLIIPDITPINICVMLFLLLFSYAFSILYEA